MSDELKELYFRIIQLSDDELLQMVNVEYDEYRPEALKFAREEMTRRGLPIEPQKNGDTPQTVSDANLEGDTFDVNESDAPEASFDEESGADVPLEVRFEIFRSGVSSWESLFEQAAGFASRIGPDDLINISHSEDANEGVVTVWYWYR